MARITDVIASTTNALAGVKPGDQLPLTAVIGADGGVIGAASPGALEQDVRTVNGILNAAVVGSQITIPINAQGTLGFTLTGLTVSGATVSFFQSNDNGNTYTAVGEVNSGTGQTSLSRTTDGQARIAASGRTMLRFQVTTAGTGNIRLDTNLTVREGLVSLASPIPAGTPELTSLDGKTPPLKRLPIIEGIASTGAASTAQTASNTTTNAAALTIMPANTAVRRRRVQNLGTATVYVRFNPTGDTTPAFVPAASGLGAVQAKQVIALAAGAFWETPVDEDASGLTSVCSTTANQTVGFSAS